VLAVEKVIFCTAECSGLRFSSDKHYKKQICYVINY
jgi:hypothetical protein